MTKKTTPSEQTGIPLTEAEWKTIKQVIHDWGLIDTYFIADYHEVEALKRKFKIGD